MIEVSPITTGFVAAIAGVDVRNLSDEAFEQIYAAWLEYGVLKLSNQRIDEDELQALVPSTSGNTARAERVEASRSAGSSASTRQAPSFPEGSAFAGRPSRTESVLDTDSRAASTIRIRVTEPGFSARAASPGSTF